MGGLLTALRGWGAPGRRSAAAAEARTLGALLTVLTTLADLVEARDPYTTGHIWRVARYTALLAEATGWDEARQQALTIAAALHDIGLVSLNDAILRKAGPLSEAELAQVRQHPLIGLRLLDDYPGLDAAIAVVGSHHERWDGAGYPRGLSGAAIPIEARLVAVADAFDALTSARADRRPLPAEAAIAEIEAEAGHHFDPALPPVLAMLWRVGALDGILRHAAEGERLRDCPACGPVIALSQHRYDVGARCPVCHLTFRLVPAGEDLTLEPVVETPEGTRHSA
jgi:hypothetical protein